ncbi:hypothetical protein O5900_07250 [Escherichia fergusonii]|nr:hypothetical protein [Escherichia fergusonii]MCZ5215087.1 hypothetical protein [Escherichia fergusonii]
MGASGKSLLSDASASKFPCARERDPDTEPFTLEGLTRYQINQQLLNTLVEQEDAERLFRRFRAAGSCLMVLLVRSCGKPSVRRCNSWLTG